MPQRLANRTWVSPLYPGPRRDNCSFTLLAR
jgi:hypothetical protein